MPEVLVGQVSHYYGRLGVAALSLGLALHRGDRIRVRGHTTDFAETVQSMEIDHHPVDDARPGDDVAIKVEGKARVGDKVYLEQPETAAAAKP